ncbi:MAG TPA: hypothetical protein VJ208_00850 [Candidatus Nanoarchaeia archaeon]|nr:hypothetical protein [Candidatus Nanoarchaeia archaeon]
MTIEIKTERDPWDVLGLNPERQVVYKNGVKIGEVNRESSWIPSFGNERERVVRDNEGAKVAVIRQEVPSFTEGNITGKSVERIYNPQGNQVAEISRDLHDPKKENISNRHGEHIGELEVRYDGMDGRIVGMTKKVFNPSYGKNADLFGRTQKDTAMISEKKTQSYASGNVNSESEDLSGRSLEGKVYSMFKGIVAITIIGIAGILLYQCSGEKISGRGTITKPYQSEVIYQSPQLKVAPKERRKQLANNPAGQSKNYGLRNPLDSLQQGFKEFEKTQRKMYRQYRLYTRPR